MPHKTIEVSFARTIYRGADASVKPLGKDKFKVTLNTPVTVLNGRRVPSEKLETVLEAHFGHTGLWHASGAGWSAVSGGKIRRNTDEAFDSALDAVYNWLFCECLKLGLFADEDITDHAQADGEDIDKSILYE